MALLRAFPPNEPTKKRFVSEMIAWSAKAGEYPNGDPELHHVAGTLFAEGIQFLHEFLRTLWIYSNVFISTEGEPYDSERHLALGTKDSAEQLAKVEYEWYTQDESHTAALYAARAVFPYLLTNNLRSANKAYLIFTSRLSSSNKSLGVQEVSSTSADMRVYPSLPLLNFLGLLLLAVQRGSSDLYKQLAKHYAPYVKEVGTWDDALAQLGEMYFGIRIPRPGNPLMVCTFFLRHIFPGNAELSHFSTSHLEDRMLISNEKGYHGFDDGIWRESEIQTQEGGCSRATGCGLTFRWINSVYYSVTPYASML